MYNIVLNVVFIINLNLGVVVMIKTAILTISDKGDNLIIKYIYK